jgi:hypothetical protein
MSTADETPIWLRPRDGVSPVRAVTEMAEKMAALIGVGVAGDDLVTANVDNAGALVALDLDPRVLRLAPTAVSAHILEAARLAGEDLRAKMQDLLRETYGDEALITDPVAAGEQVVNTLTSVSAGLQRSLDDILSEVGRIQQNAETAERL